MASVDDIREVFAYLRRARVHKCPHPGDLDIAQTYADALRNMRSDVVLEAGRSWITDPDRGSFFPTASDLLSLCIGIEAQDRTKVVKTVRGCAACGEIIREDGSIQEHGSGFRHFMQHCFPTDKNGDVDWEAAPYRVGHRLVLCDCVKGRQIAAGQQLEAQREIPKGQASGRPANWAPTMTLAQAWEAFGGEGPNVRTDCEIYVSGSHARKVPEDRRMASPWYARPSPEEEMIDQVEARRIRLAVYDSMRGNRSAQASAYLSGANLPTEGGKR